MKTTIVADWLPTYGGAEHVISALSSLWPEAVIHTTVARKEKLDARLQAADIRVSSVLQKAFMLLGRHQVLIASMPRYIEHIDLAGSDVVISSSHAVGKGVIPPATAVHVCYCHTPMRYAWEMETEYLNDFKIRWPLRKPVQRLLKYLRRWDLATAKRVDHFIANSTETQARIRRIYARESVVIPPPVDAHFFDHPLSANRGSYFLALGRMVPYKKFDLLITLANHLKLPLKIGGTGDEFARLKAMAGPTVQFLGYVPDNDLPALYGAATALFSPQMEDAGIVPMEAQAMGVPVIAYGKGGVLDVVRDGVTGVLVSQQTVDAFAEALKRFDALAFDRAAIRQHARAFHIDTFKKRIAEEVASALKH